MPDNRINSLDCFVLPGHVRDCKKKYLAQYNTAYDFWRVFMGYEMRNEKLSDIEEKLSSDGFMLFEDVFTLFYGTEIVGLFCFDTKDMSSNAIKDQSFFKSFPNDVKKEYIEPASKIMTIGHLLVHPAWRRKKIGIGLSDILVWFMHKRFKTSDCDLMLYWTRNNRSTNDLGTKHGGIAIGKNLDYGGLDADIIATRRESTTLHTGDETVDQLSQYFWDNKIDCKRTIYPSTDIANNHSDNNINSNGDSDSDRLRPSI